MVLLGAGFVASGAYDIGARGGHLETVRDLMVLTRGRSVSAHAADAAPAPFDLDDPAVIQRGAAHYARACAGCHGAPGQPPDLTTQFSLPAPPRLAAGERIPDRRPEELFWVVYNGLKFTGMPAWPGDGRVDEAWAMAAFLERLPAMSPEEFERLATPGAPSASDPELHARVEAAAPEAEPELVARCAGCHGLDGAGAPSGAFPNLTGLTARYIAASLRAYRDEARHSGLMQVQSYDLSDEQVDALAAYFEAQPDRPAPLVAASEPDEAAVEAGRAIALEGWPANEVSACTSCHGLLEATPTKRDDTLRYAPHLAGQHAAYLRSQLNAWKERGRGGAFEETPQYLTAHRRLSAEQIDAVAAYYAHLEASPLAAGAGSSPQAPAP